MTDNAISKALKMMPYGFYALGSKHGHEQNLMVINWFTQISFEPVLVAIAIKKTSFSYGLIEKSGQFTISILKSEDQETIEGFAKARAKKPDKMNEAAISAGEQTGAPVLDVAVAYLEGKVSQKITSGGDHDIFVAEIVHAEIRELIEPGQSLNLPEMGWSYAG